MKIQCQVFTTVCKLSLLPAFKVAKIPSLLFTAHTGITVKGEILIRNVRSRVTEVLRSNLLFKKEMNRAVEQ